MAKRTPKKVKPLDYVPKAGQTAPHGSMQFTMSAHVGCNFDHRAFSEGRIPLPDACLAGHATPPSPQSKGLMS